MCGDALSLMERMDNDCYHAVVTDPPYASGGLTTAERKASPARKYLSSSRYLSFDNDTRDQRTHFLWSVMWMQEALRITRHGGWLMVFSDWRQLPLTAASPRRVRRASARHARTAGGSVSHGTNDPYDFSKLTLTGIYGRNFLRHPSISPRNARIFNRFQASSSEFNPFQAFMVGHNTGLPCSIESTMKGLFPCRNWTRLPLACRDLPLR